MSAPAPPRIHVSPLLFYGACSLGLLLPPAGLPSWRRPAAAGSLPPARRRLHRLGPAPHAHRRSQPGSAGTAPPPPRPGSAHTLPSRIRLHHRAAPAPRAPVERGPPQRHQLRPRVKIQLGGQIRRTRPGQPQGSPNPVWNEEFMFVAGEPFDEPLVVTVEERLGPGRDETVGRVINPVAASFVPRNDEAAVDAMEKESKMFASKIHLRRLSMEPAYHVLDKSTHCSSDLQPSAKKLRKGAIVGE